MNRAIVILSVLLAILCATGLLATTADLQDIPVDWGITSGLGGLCAVMVWSVKQIVTALRDQAKRSEAHITKLCEVANTAIDESREARLESMAARRTFATAMNLPGHTTHIPRPKLRTTDDGPDDPPR